MCLYKGNQNLDAKTGGFSMKKSKFLTVILIGLLALSGLVLSSCGSDCRNTCRVMWSADGQRQSGSAGCAFSDCEGRCAVMRNWNSRPSGFPGQGIRIDCDC